MKKHITNLLLVGTTLALCIWASGTSQAQPDGGMGGPPMGGPPPGMDTGNSGNTSNTGSSSKGNSYGSGQGTAVIRFDEESGTLIVISDDETNQNIQKIVESMDRPIPQVLIKVLFLEVTHTNGVDLGVDSEFTYKRNGNKDTLSTIFGVAAEQTANSAGGYYKVLNDSDLEMTLRVLANTSKLEVLSRPSVMTRNNQEATITVGQEIPMIRNSRITTDGQILNTVEYEDIGIILRVTPHITPDKVVEMDVSPEISTLTGETVAISDTVNARVIALRSAATLVAVESGKTVVIGGMMQDNVTDSVKKIPVLGDIPVAGALFRRTIKSKSKTELLIFLSPLVVEGSQELQTMSDTETRKSETGAKAFTKSQMDKFLDNPDAFSKKEVDKSQPKKDNREGLFKRMWRWVTDIGL
jgi:general secretion pathway protein D